jgi:transcriptional regulator with XRE-family HTH domain
MPADQRSHFARTLSRLRREAGLSQNALALLADLDRQTLHMLELRQSSDPSRIRVQKLALVLGVSTEVFRNPRLTVGDAERRRKGRPRNPPGRWRQHRYLVRYHGDRGAAREEVFAGRGANQVAAARLRELRRAGAAEVRLVCQGSTANGWVALDKEALPPRPRA